MHISLILDNLIKLDCINDFISIIEIKFSEDVESNKKITTAKKLLNQFLMDYISKVDVDRNLLFDEKNTNNITLALKIFDNSFFKQQIKNFDLFLSDLKDLESFFNNLINHKSPIFIEGNDEDIAIFKEKRLSILAKKFN
ncbi:MAG: hypothetical protein FJ368_00060 [Pelagibacterales bacterium]|nr:hypothetical protein [Pelagibacterales bacterium]